MDRTKIEVGMTVTYTEDHTGSTQWVDGMEEFIGEPFLVLGIYNKDGTAFCECGDLMFWLEIDWLEPYEEGE